MSKFLNWYSPKVSSLICTVIAMITTPNLRAEALGIAETKPKQLFGTNNPKLSLEPNNNIHKSHAQIASNPVLNFPDGSHYEGEVLNAQANGKGVIFFANGDRYEGEFQDSKLDGSGNYTFKKGDHKVGQWTNGGSIIEIYDISSLSQPQVKALIGVTSPHQIVSTTAKSKPNNSSLVAQNNSQVTAEPSQLREPPVYTTSTATSKSREGTPGSSITSPSAFGAQLGDVFAGISYQDRTRFTNSSDGAVAVGFGLGNPSEIVGLDIAITSTSTVRRGLFNAGTVSLKLHRLITNDLAVAAGIENLVTWGVTDGDTSAYGVVTKYFQLEDTPDKPFSSVIASIGFGGGRFRSESNIENGIGSVNVFGSIALRVFRPLSLIADWSGQTLGLGLSIAPFRNLPITITPAVVDVTNGAGNGPRFTLGISYGLRF